MKVKKLSNKILIGFFIISIAILVLNYFIFERIAKKSFYDSEKEKVEIIAKTISPLIGVELFLGFNNKIEQLSKELLKNRNFLAVYIIKNNKILIKKSKNIKEKDYFTISYPITKPNSNKKIALLKIIYSSRHYKDLIKNYQKTLFISLILIGFVMILFGIYLNWLLKPLKDIANKLENFNPKKMIELNCSDRDDEIGLISKALMNMQQKIKNYSLRLENINEDLERRVEEKTKELKEQLYTDSLTKLPNRFALNERIKESKKVSLLIIDIDNFKHINDLFGVEIGDEILKSFSIRLKDLLKKTKFVNVYRLSGDEFAIMFNKKMNKADMNQFIEILINSIEKMVFLHNENELNIRVTIGVAIDSTKPLEEADIALKSAKKCKKAFVIYNENMKIEKEYKENIEWVKKIKKAIKEDRIVPYFQPIFYSDDLKLKSYESLMRLIDEDGNAISPFFFIDIAKRSRYYPELTKIMFQKCCEYFKDKNCKFSFNLSIEDIYNEDMLLFIKETINRCKIENRIIFEILESEGIENFQEVSKFINDIHSLGAQIAIDDFGSGYSNFEYLVKLDIDYIKIDGSLIKNIDKDENSKIVVGVIKDYAKKKGIKTVAEFVSSKEIYETIKELGVDFVQGYYAGKPSPSATC